MSQQQLADVKVAILVANSGVEQIELERPWQELKAAGAETTLIAPSRDVVQAVKEDIHPADTFTPDQALADVTPDQFDALLLPGGVANPDQLRVDEKAVAFVKAFAQAGKPVAAICHAPWTLVEAGVLGGKTLTSWPSLQTDIRNAGGTWVDEKAVTCTQSGFPLVTSRRPDDLDAFIDAVTDAFARARS